MPGRRPHPLLLKIIGPSATKTDDRQDGLLENLQRIFSP